MTIKSINYTKKDGTKSKRVVLVLNKNSNYEDVIDFQYLSDDDIKEVIKIHNNYEKTISPYIKKAFRRLSSDGIEFLQEEEYEVT